MHNRNPRAKLILEKPNNELAYLFRAPSRRSCTGYDPQINSTGVGDEPAATHRDCTQREGVNMPKKEKEKKRLADLCLFCRQKNEDISSVKITDGRIPTRFHRAPPNHSFTLLEA